MTVSGRGGGDTGNAGSAGDAGDLGDAGGVGEIGAIGEGLVTGGFTSGVVTAPVLFTVELVDPGLVTGAEEDPSIQYNPARKLSTTTIPTSTRQWLRRGCGTSGVGGTGTSCSGGRCTTTGRGGLITLGFGGGMIRFSTGSGAGGGGTGRTGCQGMLIAGINASACQFEGGCCTPFAGFFSDRGAINPANDGGEGVNDDHHRRVSPKSLACSSPNCTVGPSWHVPDRTLSATSVDAR